MVTKTRLQTVMKLGKFEIKRRKKFATTSVAKIPKISKGPVVGVSGNAPQYGNMATGEFLNKLEGQKGRAIYDEMRRSDPQIQSTLKAIKLSIRQATYFVEPGSEDTKDVEIAETIEDNLLKGMSLTWDDTIRHALLMLDFGFSALEKVWEIRDNKLFLRKLDPRLPMSVTGWKYDEKKKRTTDMLQRDGLYNEYSIPIEKLLVFTSDKEGDNWEGIPILRAVYKPWFIKDKFEKINAIKHERFGIGVPVGKVPKGITENSEQWGIMEQALEDLYASEKSYLIEPEGYEFRLLGGTKDSQGSDALPSIKYYDEAIAKTMLAMFISLGTSQTGSRALGGTFLDIFLLSLQSYADYICEVINRFLIKEYVISNWGEVEQYPSLKVGQIKQFDPIVLAKLIEVGVITADEAIENSTRETLHLPEKTEEEEDEEKKEPPVKKKPKIEEEETEEDKEVKPVETHDRKFIDRELSEEELMVDVRSIELNLNEAQRTLEDQILQIKQIQTDDIIMQLVGGRKIQNIRIIQKKEMHDVLLKEFKRQIRRGKEEAKDEVKSQLMGQKLADPAGFDYQDYLDMIEEQFAIKVEGASNKLAALLATQAAELKRAGITGDALRMKLLEYSKEKISDSTWTAVAAGSVNKGWGQGRDLIFKEYTEDEDYSYYSAILDGNACPSCLEKDGVEHKYGDPLYITPNTECEGGDRCRCMTIMVMKSESAPEEEWQWKDRGGA